MKIKSDIQLRLKGRKVIGQSCFININPNEISCDFECEDQDDELSYILSKMSMSTNISARPNHIFDFENTTLGEEKVKINRFKINFSQIKIKTVIGSNKTFVTIGLQEVELQEKKKCKDITTIYFNKESKEILVKKIDDEWNSYYDDLIVSYKGETYTFKYDKDMDTVLLKTVLKESHKEVEDLVCLISLFFRIPMHCCIIETNKEEFSNIKCRTCNKNGIEGISVNPRRMLSSNELVNLQKFLNSVDTKVHFKEGDFFNRLVNNYVHCQYYDPINRFITLCISIISIPPKVLGKELLTKKDKNGKDRKLPEVKKVKNLFKELRNNGCKGIDYTILNKEIREKHFIATKDEGNSKVIQDFITLRDEIIHGLASEEILSFLDEDDVLITKLEILSFDLIVNLLGIKDVEINPFYQYFDIFMKVPCQSNENI